MFTSRLTKHSKLLVRHARKYLRYRDDLLSTQAREELRASVNALGKALYKRGHTGIKTEAEALDAKLHQLTPVTWESHWRENCEANLVAVVVAIGIRSYFLQPFKIPTGSMQPTLNGIIGPPSTAPRPNLLQQAAEFIVLGRNYIDVVSRADDEIVQIQEKKFLFFFTLSRIIGVHEQYLVYAPAKTLADDFNVFVGRSVRRGELIARGAIDTGDQVFVDKFSYNFVKPHRGDVFVFRTNHILGIREDPATGAPFYIKRLAGLPGDRLRIDPRFLSMNGKKAEGYGFARVMSAKPPYRGYGLGHEYLSQPDRTFTVPKDGYFALGDN